MKTKRRHQLETNELAEWLAQTYASLRPFGNYLLWGAVAFAALVLGASWLIQSSRAPGEQAAVMLTSALASQGLATSPDQQLEQRRKEFQELADSHPESLAGKWGRLLGADALRREGTRTLTTDRDGAGVALRNAERDYKKLIDAPSGLALLDERALLGRAKALEALGELVEARKLYRQLLDRHKAEEITVERDLGEPERADLYLARRFAKTAPLDVLGGLRAGLVEMQRSGGWEPVARNTVIEPGMKLRLQLRGPFTVQARERLNALSDDEVVRFYEWLQTAELPSIDLPPLSSGENEEKGDDENQEITPEFEPEASESSTADPKSETAPEPTAPKTGDTADQPAPAEAPESDDKQAGEDAKSETDTNQPTENAKPESAPAPEAPN